ncbi:MAG: phage tail tape measure protein [bacterium]|nr:phage tail tape measure protein [bacterium]
MIGEFRTGELVHHAVYLLATAHLAVGVSAGGYAFAATITVTGSVDGPFPELDGNNTCDFREAIQASNLDSMVGECPSGSGFDTIAFNICGGGLQSILPYKLLPTITDPVLIDGTTQPDCGGTPCIEIDGSETVFACNGLTITAGDSTVRGLVINGFNGHGISISERGHNVVESSFIGTDHTGMSERRNSGIGIEIKNSPYNTIGGSTDRTRNVISGSVYGVAVFGLDSSNNTISGNYIGTDSQGEASLSNTSSRCGVCIFSASFNTIGGTENGEGNLISGHGYGWLYYSEGHGVLIHGDDNRIIGNRIGTDATGFAALGNSSIGVSIVGRGNEIGGADPGAGNLISGNGSFYHDVEPWKIGIGIGLSGTGNIVQGNLIGTDASGKQGLGNWRHGIWIANTQDVSIGGTAAGASNTIAFNGENGIAINDSPRPDEPESSGIRIVGNSIFENGDLGIDLGAYKSKGVTSNDPLDTDDGPNNLQNYPILTDAVRHGNRIVLAGRLESTPETKFEIDFYANQEADPSGHGEGEVYLGQTIVTTDDLGEAEFITSFPIRLETVQNITATAADPDGNTSEFSLALAITDPEPLTSPRRPGLKTLRRAKRMDSVLQ